MDINRRKGEEHHLPAGFDRSGNQTEEEQKRKDDVDEEKFFLPDESM